jgi:ABC-2 type transport system ATP-binding protein
VVEIEAYGVEEASLERLRRIEEVTSVSVEERDQSQLLLVQSAAGLEITQRLLAELNGARVGRVASREPTLEDAYVALVTEAGG